MPLLEAIRSQDLPGLPLHLAPHLHMAFLPPAHLYFLQPFPHTKPVPTSVPFLLQSFSVSLSLSHVFILSIQLSITDNFPPKTLVHLSKTRTFILLQSSQGNHQNQDINLEALLPSDHRPYLVPPC